MKEKSKPKRRKEPASKESMSEKVETKMAVPPAPPVSVRSAAKEEVHTRAEPVHEQEKHHHHHHEKAHEPEKPPTGATFSLQQFVTRFVPCNQRGEPLLIQNWNDVVNKPGVMMGVIGQGKVWASSAAHQQKCWTVMKLGENKFQVEAGMNTSEVTKIGYLATQKPWDSLETTVA